jgi:hypothetical protein
VHSDRVARSRSRHALRTRGRLVTVTVAAIEVAVQRRVNTELLLLYQLIGKTLLERTESEAWESGVITQLANDLRA